MELKSNWVNEKAGMEKVDKAKIAAIVAELTKDSPKSIR
jgi:hypothetical protein